MKDQISTPAFKIENVKVKATAVAQVCPVCNSFGTVTRNRIKCHGCEGRGYILIPAEVVHR